MKKINKITIVLLAGFWLLSASGELRAQERSVTELMQTARELGMDQANLEQLKNTADARGITDQQLIDMLEPALSMAREDLPAELVIQKVQEGFSKGVPANRIIPVVTRIRETAGSAAKMVDPWLQRPEVQNFVQSDESVSRSQFRNELTKASSRALMKDISANTVEDLLTKVGNNESVMQRASSPDIVAAVGILPDLPDASNEARNSNGFIVRALEAGFGADELFKLPSAVNMAHSRSQLPASAVIEQVANQLKGGIPAKEILQNLFNGNIGGGPPGNIPKGLENGKNRGRGSGNG